MSNNIPVSVIVLTYNASWKKIRATLNSIILQKDIDFEIIVADDCSQDNHSGKIKDFFSRHSFTNYKLILREKNLGTVRNFLDAAQKAEGDYIRPIGQGDMFFDEYVLIDSYNNISEKRAICMGSKVVCFKARSNPVQLKKFTRCPQNIKAYDNPETLRESYLINSDRTTGPSLMYERTALIEYLNQMINNQFGSMKYYEDHAIKFMVFDKKTITFLNRNTVYYEVGDGISSSGILSAPISESMFNDGIISRNLMLERCKAGYPDEFCQRLASIMEKEMKNSYEMKNIEKKPKLLALPLKFFQFISRSFMRLRRRMRSVTTDINVPTDFANLCINRE